jgi:hypothetical protein
MHCFDFHSWHRLATIAPAGAFPQTAVEPERIGDSLWQAPGSLPVNHPRDGNFSACCLAQAIASS